MSKKIITQREIDEKFASFVNQMMMLRLINSGQSNMSDRQSELHAKALGLAYEILSIAKERSNSGLFNRVSRMTIELMPSPFMKKVMKHPEMYEEMLNAQAKFNVKVYDLLGGSSSYPFMKSRGSR